MEQRYIKYLIFTFYRRNSLNLRLSRSKPTSDELADLLRT